MNIPVDINILSEMAWRVIRSFVLLSWSMLWPLALGFLLSAWVRTRVPAALITRQLGKNSVPGIFEASIFGIVSSVCNYAVTGMAKTLYDKGATWPNIMLYMLASTNLGITMLLTVYGFMGLPVLGMLASAGILSMMIVWTLSFLFFPKDTRPPLAASGDASKSMWMQTAIHFYDDVAMTRNDILTGVSVAALASALVPAAWWQALFLHEHGASALVWLWNAALGLVLAVLTFGCSIGNVALAAVLWWNGASPGGVMAFMLGSLLTVPMLHVYYRNFGGRMTSNLAWVQAVGVICAAFAVDALVWRSGMVLPQIHTTTHSDEAAWFLLMGNIVLGGIGIAFYRVGKKNSSMGGMMGMGNMGSMDGMGDMSGMNGMDEMNGKSSMSGKNGMNGMGDMHHGHEHMKM